jgi:hypothetical protein
VLSFFTTGIVPANGNFTAIIISHWRKIYHQCHRGDVNIGKDVTTSVNDIGGTFAAGVTDTGGAP